jgi:hypothetical protein
MKARPRTPLRGIPRVPMALCLLALAGCNDDTTAPSYARLNRSNAVDFACVERTASEQPGQPETVTLVALQRCRVQTAEDYARLTPYAFVTQSARGEIATIDLRTHNLLDTRKDIPGYTFVPTGESPTAIIVPPNRSAYTYVANFGSRDVRVFDTRSLIPPTLGTGPVQIVALQVAGPMGPLPAAPTQMVLAPNEDALFVTLPALGRVMKLPLCGEGRADCAAGLIDESAIGSIALQASVAKIVASEPAPAAPAYEQLCNFVRPELPPAQPPQMDPASLAAASRPNGLAIDASCKTGDLECTPRLLVADEGLPLIHVVDLNAVAPGENEAALLAPIVVGVPTVAVAVTPRVPVSLGSLDETHYVYAIDATDGSVMVIEGSRVLNVNEDPSARPDRILITSIDGKGPPSAGALAVLTPGFDPGPDAAAAQYLRRHAAGAIEPDENLEDFCPEPGREIQNSNLLRGVFVGIALSDASVRLVDIHDMTLLSSDPALADPASEACRKCPGDRIPILVRHHLRLQTNAEGLELTSPAPVPMPFEFSVEGQQFSIRTDGTSGSPDAPSLQCTSCDGLVPIFPLGSAVATPSDAMGDATTAATASGAPEPAQDAMACTASKPALLCSGEDPWSNLEERWFATYEGVIPGTIGGGAVFVTPGSSADSVAPMISAPMEFCSSGVLGTDDVAAAYEDAMCDPSSAEPAPIGDQFVITSKLVDSVGPECAAARKALEAEPKLVLSFEIRRAYRDHLFIASRLTQTSSDALLAIRDYQDVQRCLDGAPMSFQIRTQDSFQVSGYNTGFQHRVMASRTGRCVVDPTKSPELQGRARAGCVFRNGSVSFSLRSPGADDREPQPGVQLLLGVRSPLPKLFLDAGDLGYDKARVIPTQLRYLAIGRQLYLVDISERGLIPIPAGDQPFPARVDSTLTYN